MNELQQGMQLFHQFGAAGLLMLVFSWWHKSSNDRAEKMVDAMIDQHKEDNARIDKMIDIQREDSNRNFGIMRENQDVLLLQTKSMEQLGDDMRVLSKRFDDFVYMQNRRVNEPSYNAVKN